MLEVGGIDRGLFEGIIPICSWLDWKIPRKTSLRKSDPGHKFEPGISKSRSANHSNMPFSYNHMSVFSENIAV